MLKWATEMSVFREEWNEKRGNSRGKGNGT
jgi:hypothetical protein